MYGKGQAGLRLFKFIPVITGVADGKEQTVFDCAQIYCLAIFVLTDEQYRKWTFVRK